MFKADISNLDSFRELKKITDKYYSDWEPPRDENFVNLIEKYGIMVTKRKDGRLCQTTFSIPISVSGIVLGFRYKKQDGSYSEDLFLFQNGKSIQCGYKGIFEKTILPEYNFTHKRVPTL